MDTKAKWPDGMRHECSNQGQHRVWAGSGVCVASLHNEDIYDTTESQYDAIAEYRARQICALPKMVELLKVAVKFYEFSLNADICDCDANGHWCGKPERDKELCEMKDILREIGEIE